MPRCIDRFDRVAPLRLCLWGASPDTHNHGVTALCYSILEGICKLCPTANVTLFDHGWGMRHAVYDAASSNLKYDCFGARHSRRLFRQDSLWNIRQSCRFRGLGNPGAHAILNANAILDISGGDSFTDLYGRRRFAAVAATKTIALDSGASLILLPQTYGPFTTTRNRRRAISIIRRARTAWARDARSMDRLRELLGSDIDPARHRLGVDVAFGLPSKPPTALPHRTAQWLASRSAPVIGVNVSGLIANDANVARQFGLLADYRRVILEFLNRVVAESEERILLVPHVITPEGHFESDVDACRRIFEVLNDRAAERVAVLPSLSDPREVKWVIGQLDWFCGTRMHSTIAALSSGVPVAAIAYSDKTLGVFETCGQGEHVHDLRKLSTQDMVERLFWSWQQRDAARAALQNQLPHVLRQAEEQMDEIVTMCRSFQGAPRVSACLG
jgi:colanic acid/amylovoran biosynthesis protein